MASRGQSIVVTYVAWDTVNNVGKTGDVANHTLRWIKDGTAAAPTNAASEIDATNVPGVYKITLTTAECTCDSGTLAGKSSTANISIMPKDVTFEQLPTAAPGATNGLGILSATGAIPSNVTQINGSLTNGNNAILKLKSLDIQSDASTISSLNIVGFNGTGGDNNGGKAVNITGGAAFGSSGNGSGGDGIYIVGGPKLGSGTIGRALRILANGTGGGGGVYISGTYGQTPVTIETDSITAYPIRLIHDSGIGTLYGNISGSINNVSTSRPVKNVGYDNFMFPMFDSSTKSPKTGLSVTAERAIDGNPFSPCSNAVAELGSGVYRISLSASDMNGDKIMFRFTATGADDQLIEVFTQG
ncbi:MAG: hypothetical protein E6Q97_27120 [Desulfurellales bacterium]|nr:MAG: hypothetical protein E6Q97_27120 [Desulfurellales bacterium]